MKKILIAALTLLLCGASLCLASPKEDGEVFKIAISEVSDGEAHFFKANIDGVSVKYFVVKSPDGKIRTAFDACDVCYPEHKGFKQADQFMVCVNCNQKFHLNRIGEAKGGCNPGPLKNTQDETTLTISKADLREGLKYFK